MSAARTFAPAEEQDPRSDARSVRDRLKNLGKSPKPLWRSRDAMGSAKPLSDASHTFNQLKAFLKKRTLSVSISGALNKPSVSEREAARLISTEKPSHKIGIFGGFTVEVTGKLTGWRVTTTDQATGIQHEFYVHDGEIHLVSLPSSPPWNHSTQFVVGCRVKRIMDSEKRAILQAVSRVSPGASKIQQALPTRESWY
jgi:hypothetical protein